MSRALTAAAGAMPLPPAMEVGRLSREWFLAQELAELGLPGIPGTKRGVNMLAAREGWADPDFEGVRWRQRQGRGGGIEYHWVVLPEAARLAVALRFPQGEAQGPSVGLATRQSMAEAYDRLPSHRKSRAERAAAALDQVAALEHTGSATLVAMERVAAATGISRSTLYEWRKITAGAPRADWKYWLAPRHKGTSEEAPFTPEAWRELLGDYLRPERPTLEACMRRLRSLGEGKGWTIPSNRTVLRRVEALPPEILVLYRDGEEALKRMYPAQRRAVHVLHALQAVNADGHVWDVFVRWEDGTIGRPVMVAFQDIYSRMVVSWRIDRTENRHAVRLAFGDLVERFGIPDAAYMDNGRHFASKWICGGTPTRYRFKVRDDEPLGLLTGLGVEVHFTRPYSGQSKPIERVFRDFAGDLAKHPAFAGAWTGNDPLAKPENYGSAAVPIALFREVVAAGIAEWNARPGRTGGVARGESYQAVFDESYARAPIRKATAEQRSLWLLAAEALTVRRDSTLELLGNRFHADFLPRLRGTQVTVRFDPDALKERPLLVYGHDGALLGEAPCIDDSGFDDAAAAQEAARRNRALLRHTKAAHALLNATPIEQLQSRVAALDAAAAGGAPSPSPGAAPRVVRPVFPRTAGNAALRAEHDAEAAESEALLLRALRERHGPLRLVPSDENGGE